MQKQREERRKGEMRKYYMLFPLIALVFWGCGGEKKEERGIGGGVGIIEGRAVLSDQVGLENADHSGIRVSVEFYGISTTTDKDGNFILRDVPSGIVSVTASKEGYDTVEEPVEVPSNGKVTLSLTLQPGSTINGIAQLRGRTNHGGIRVKVEGTDIATTTDEDGNYTLKNLKGGTYKLIFEGPKGYEPTSITVIVPERGRVDAPDVILEKEPQEKLFMTLEAETMDHSTGGATADGWNIWSNGTISATVTFPRTGQYLFKVIARGDEANGWPHMELRIDGKTVGSTFVETKDWKAFPFKVEVTQGAHLVAVAFTNDFYQPPLDRNLHVDKVEIYELVR
jgi:hypothetical protein